MYSYIFDIGGVLLNFDYKNIIETLSQKTNCETDKIGDLLFKKEYIYPVETGKITGKEFFIGFVQQIMPQLTYEEWILHHIDNCTVNKSGIDLLLELKGRGKDVYLLSNLAEYHKIAWEKSYPDIFKICRKNFLSYIMGCHKPEREIYLKVCNGIGKEAGLCVFFDDTKKILKER